MMVLMTICSACGEKFPSDGGEYCFFCEQTGKASEVSKKVTAFEEWMKSMLDRLPRNEVMEFALLMEDRLRANDHKPGWKSDTSEQLFARLLQEARELEDALTAVRRWIMTVGDRQPTRKQVFEEIRKLNEDVLHECADVGNFAMMIADVVGGIGGSDDDKD